MTLQNLPRPNPRRRNPRLHLRRKLVPPGTTTAIPNAVDDARTAAVAVAVVADVAVAVDAVEREVLASALNGNSIAMRVVLAVIAT